jgi:hypothetical protein
VSREELTTGLRVLSKNAYEAARGGKAQSEAFARLGVSVKDANGEVKPAAQLLEDAADGFSALKSETDKTALAQVAFGRSGTALLPLFAQGTEAIRKMRLQANEFGSVLDEDLIALGSQWDDSTKDITYAMQGLRNVVGKALLPTLNHFNRSMAQLIVRGRKLIQSGLDTFIRKVAQLFESAFDFGVRVVNAIERWISAMSPLQQAILKASAAMVALAALLLLPGASLLILSGLIALVIDDFEVWRKGGKSAIGDLIGSLDELKTKFPEVSGALKVTWEALSTTASAIANTLVSLAKLLVDVWRGPEAALNDFSNSMKTVGEDFAALKKLIGAGETRLVELPTRSKTLPPLALTREQLAAQARASAVGWPTAAATGRAPGGVSNTQSNQIDISVNVAGAPNPEAIGQAVARPVERVLERQNREALRNLTVGAQ